VRKISGLILILFLFSVNYSFCQRQNKNKILSNVGKYNLIEFSKLPDIVRGYEEVRLETVEEFYNEADKIFK